jgi:hypothetical protein
MKIDAHTVAAELSARARTPIGFLQEIRVALKSLSRRPGHDIFSSRTTNHNYAFHNGGRSELQFNIGDLADTRGFRFGVAFSFETSQAMPTPIDVLAPKVGLFKRLRLVA